MAEGDISINLRLDDKDFTVNVKNANRLLAQLRQKLLSTAGGADRAGHSIGSVATHFRHTVLMAASLRFALMDLDDVFLTLPRGILKTTGEFERLTKLMQGLSKQTTAAAREAEAEMNVAFVTDVAKRAPFELKALSDVFVKMKTGGIDPTNGSMKALTDSVARFGGNSEVLHRASIAIQQMGGKGVVSMEELRQQLGEAVPTAMNMMAIGMKMTMAELTATVSKGTVESKDALQRMFTVMTFENRGAAAEMMTTWEGMTSRMKTEWSLLQNEVGKSGFMDEMKKQLGDLTGALSSPEALQFARELGQDLAQAVRMARSLADAMRENWVFVKMVGEAMLVYFAASKLSAIGSAFKRLGDDMKQRGDAAAASYRNEIAQENAKVAAIAQMEAAELARQAEDEAKRIAMVENRYRILTAKHAAYLATLRGLDAQQDIRAAKLDARGIDPTGNAAYMKTQREIAALERKAKAVELTIEAERKIGMVAQGNMAVLTENIAKKQAIAAAATSAANGLGLMARAGGAMRFAMAALGGPIGLITTALTIAIPLWIEWGNKGEEAINKIRDAMNSGSSKKTDVDSIDKIIAEKRADLAAIDEAEKNQNWAETSDPEGLKRAWDRRRAILKSEIATFDAMRSKVYQQSLTNESREYADGQVKIVNSTLDLISNRHRTEMAAIETNLEEKLKAVKRGSKEEKDLQDAAKKDRTNQIISEAEERAKAITRFKKSADDQLTWLVSTKAPETEIVKGRALVNEANKMFLDAMRDRNNALHLLEDPVLLAKSKKTGKIKTGERDPLDDAIEKAKASVESAKIKLDDLEDGAISFDRLRASIAAKLEGDRLAGRFDFKDAAGVLHHPDKEDKRLAELATYEAQQDQVNREIKAQKELNKLKAEVGVERQMSSDRLEYGEGYEKETSSMMKLRKELAATKRTLIEGSEAFKKFELDSQGLISDQAISDLQNFAAELKKKTAEIRAEMNPDERSRKQAIYLADVEQMNAAFEVRRKQIVDDATLTSQERSDAIKKAETELGDWLLAKSEQHARNMRHPLDRLNEDWKDITKQMESASEKWATATADAIANMLTGGKTSFRDFAASILKDILSIQIKSTMGDAITGMGKSLSDFAGNSIKASNGDKGAGDAVSSVFSSLVGAGKRLWASMTGASDATSDVAASAAEAAVKTTLETTNTVSKMTAEQASTLAMANLTMAAQAAATALYQVTGGSMGSGLGGLAGLFTSGGASAGSFGGGDAVLDSTATMAQVTSFAATGGIFGPNSAVPLHKFANGGLWNVKAPMALRKFAKGGITRTPEFALFGEAGPEAFVPLPDGRSIPVTMNVAGGGGGGNVVISISVTNNKEDGSSSEGGDAKEQSFYKGLADQIKEVVIQQMVVQQRPGGVLSRS